MVDQLDGINGKGLGVQRVILVENLSVSTKGFLHNSGLIIIYFYIFRSVSRTVSGQALHRSITARAVNKVRKPQSLYHYYWS